MSERLARELKLPAESIMHMNTAGFLHDIGKIGVSEDILDKVEKLTDEEWAQIQEHPVKGADIISHIEFLDGIVGWVNTTTSGTMGRAIPRQTAMAPISPWRHLLSPWPTRSTR